MTRKQFFKKVKPGTVLIYQGDKENLYLVLDIGSDWILEIDGSPERLEELNDPDWDWYFKDHEILLD